MSAKALVLSCLLLLGGSGLGAATASGFVIIVNAANPVSVVERESVRKMFLKKMRSWSNGERVKPVDLQATSSTRESFSRAVLSQAADAVEELWQRQIFEGRDVPPPRKASEAEVIDFVARNPGAIGYVAADSALPPGVKPVRIQESR
jgi:ABC-type phosphate transport system substrate-binding protein